MDMLKGISSVFDAASAHVQHGALLLLGAVTMLKADISELEADSPPVKQVADASTTWADAHGVPVEDIGKLGEDVLTVARAISPAAPKVDAVSNDAAEPVEPAPSVEPPIEPAPVEAAAPAAPPAEPANPADSGPT